MCNAIEAVAPNFESYEQYARSDLEEIFSDAFLDGALRLEVSESRTGVFVNDGSGTFSFSPLQGIAQGSASFGVALFDCNNDGHTDLVLAQNDFSPQRETGRIDGGLGLLMLGDSAGHFTPVMPAVSGIVLPGDSKSLLRSDVNCDGTIDVIIGINNAPAHVLIGNPDGQSSFLAVHLRGPLGNKLAAGARITARYSNGTRAVSEVYSGNSYLSQGTSVSRFHIGEHMIRVLEIRWPDGSISSHDVSDLIGGVTIQYPEPGL